MKRVLGLLTLIATLFTSCGLRDDGAMNFDGKAVNILYFRTDKDLNIIKNSIVKKMGEPKYLDEYHNELLYENYDLSEFKNIKVKILFNREEKPAMNDQGNLDWKTTGQSVNFAFIDDHGNDLLRKNSASKKKIEEYLNNLNKELKMY